MRAPPPAALAAALSATLVAWSALAADPPGNEPVAPPAAAVKAPVGAAGKVPVGGAGKVPVAPPAGAGKVPVQAPGEAKSGAGPGEPVPVGEVPVDDADEEEVIRAPRVAREAAGVAVGADQGRKIAGTQGDALKVVQNLPGVARSSFGGGQIVVWGSPPADTRVLVDGVEIPALYHGGGLRSTLATDLVRSVELVPGAYGAEYGRALGGLVRVGTRDLPPEGVHGFVAADFLDASAMVTAALGRVRAGAAGRFGYLDRLLSGVVAPDAGEFFPVPRYFDAQAKAQIALRAGESIEATYLVSGDALDRVVPSADPAGVRRQTTESGFHRVYMRYSTVLPDGASAVVTPFFGRDEAREASAFGSVPLRLSTGAWKYGVRAGYRGRLARWATLSVGADVLGALSSVERTGSLSLPAREGDLRVFGQAPAGEVASDAWSAHVLDAAPFASAEIEVGPLTFTPGLRFDAYLIEASRRLPRVGAIPPIGLSRIETALAPRISAAWRPSERLSVTAAGGLYHQPPEPEELSATFGTPVLGLSRGWHASLGAEATPWGALSVSVTGFYRSLDRLAVRSRLSTPRLAQALVQDGEGRSYGVQLLVKQELWRGLQGWISYSMSRSERRYRGDAGFRLLDFDQPHVLAVVASQELFGFTASARVRASAGAPRTPVVRAYYDARADAYQPVFGAQNTARLPAFFQLDLRVERSFALRPFTLTGSLDVLNVTNQENPEEIVYSFDYRRQGFITGLPLLAVLGARIEM